MADEAKFVSLYELSGIVDVGKKFKVSDYVAVSNFEELVFTKLSNPFQIPKYKVFETAYFSAKGCPCSYPFQELAPFINFVSSLGGTFTMHFPKKTGLMFIKALDGTGKELCYSIAPMLKSIYQEELSDFRTKIKQGKI